MFKKIVFTIQSGQLKPGEKFFVDFDKETCQKYKAPDAINFRRSIFETFHGRPQPGGTRSAGWLKRNGLEKQWSVYMRKVEGVPRIYFEHTPITRVITRKGEHKTTV